ncbi:hypothetical protein FQN55_003646 [Onygenales sp. PD_40]|nr:hypothetical protein FQN55_003646 [Onygenales sp. PD_40]KAK2789753.1 hypothetical protein FQN52_005878 [Onygenales sp. PD_12]KAK2802757.1 hypothetical protein FQN51_004285 [Onygenales sp. PD_10]
MSAAIATRPSPRIGRPASRTESPMDAKKGAWKNDDNQSTSSDKKDATQGSDADNRRQDQQQAGSDTPDYFSGVHNTTQFSLEPNPFEQSFSNQPADTPGKSILPPVAALTSPAIPGTTSAGGFNWSNSLRAGPLSPAMLAGPASNDYFDGIGRGFPTPNESSLRTGLTPGGGGSMFPSAASPNTQAIMQQFQSGGATPATLDFHRTALQAARKSAPTSNPQDAEQILQQSTNLEVSKTEPQADPFAHPDATDAANGLFMLAKGGQPNNGQFAVPTSQPITQSQSANSNGVQNGNGTSQDMNGGASDSAGDQPKANARGKGRKNNNAKASNGRRKADDAASKATNKKAKGNNGTALDQQFDGLDSDDEDEDAKPSQNEGNPRKMTDEEKRKNFLERNRVAALKCRQRKKQWLQNLQTKVEFFTTENDALSSTVTQLREEIVNLKTLLLAHKDCPISQAQGLNSIMLNTIANEYGAHPNPYMMQTGAPGMPQQPMPRR